jgi:voltage-gated potassium channel Kch
MTPITIYSALKEPNDSGVPSSPLLITPVRQKAYAVHGGTIQSLWSQTEIALNNAARLVIIGYSFPETDTRPIELIRKAVKSRTMAAVEVVAPDADQIVARLKGTIGESDKLQAHPMTFVDYIFKVLGSTASAKMTEALAVSPEVRSWLERVYVMHATAIRRQKASRKTSQRV